MLSAVKGTESRSLEFQSQKKTSSSDQSNEKSLQSDPRKPKKQRKRKGNVCVGMTVCRKCKKALAYSSVSAHMRRKHPTDSDCPYTCECGANFTTLAQRHTHRISAHGYQPSIREQKEPNTAELLTNLAKRRKFRPKVFETKDARHCHVCGKRCKNRRAYLRHRRLFHVNGRDDDGDGVSNDDTTPGPSIPVVVTRQDSSAAKSTNSAKVSLSSVEEELKKTEKFLQELRDDPEFQVYLPESSAPAAANVSNGRSSLLDGLFL